MLLAFFALLVSCGGDTPKPEGNGDETNSSIPDDFTVRVLIRGNHDGLNTMLAQSAISSEILDYNVHCNMLEVDPETFELKPSLATSRPEIKVQEDGNMTITFEIREEAVWDNGTPITAEDYAFTIKAVKNPKTAAAPQRPFFEFIEDVVIDENNPKKFTVLCNKPYFLAETVTGGFAVLPAYHYDPQGLMSEFTIGELNDPANLDRLNADSRIISFADDFNKNYNHDAEKIVGCGPYKIKEIATHQHVLLERKKDWWGDKVDVDYIAAYPEKILYKIIEEDNNSILALKEQELDVVTYISEEPFLELQKNERATKNFNLFTPNSFAYRYLGMNMRSDKLSDVRVRKAIAHLVDKKHVIEELCSNLAVPTKNPINPMKKYYNNNIPEIEFSVEKAKELLTAAGWTDTDGDNILDKMIEGQKVSLKLRFLYPQGKQFYKDIAQVLKDEAARVGIEIEMAASEWSVMLDDLKERKFDLTCLGWSASPNPDDLKQIWHTSSDTYEGSNTVSFGNEESDKLIEEVRTTMDEAKRNELYMRFQEIVYEQQPYVFLVSPKLCTAVSKRFKNAKATPLRPGYNIRMFQLANEN